MINNLVVGLLLLYSTLAFTRDVFHERVLWYDNPSHEALIAWTSENETARNHVLVSLNSDMSDARIYTNCMSGRIKEYTDYYVHCWLNGLQPDTDHYFQVQSNQHTSEILVFKTAPLSFANSERKLIFGGDSRSDYKQRQLMNKAIQAHFKAHPETLALVHGGDFIEDGGDPEQWYWWFEDYLLTRVDNRVLPIVPTRGNHESDRTLYTQMMGDTKSEGDHYFRSRIGELSIITLNTNISHYGSQKAWLEKTLAEAQADSRWVTVNYHRPAFPAVKRPGDALNAWVPMFEDAQIDLAFESDGHAYKQTAPIYRGKVDSDKGIIYVGEGGLGVRQRSVNSSRWYLQGSGKAFSKHHFQVLSLSLKSMGYQAIGEDGAEFSSFTLNPRPERADSGLPIVVPKVPEAPKQGDKGTKPLPPSGPGDLPAPPGSGPMPPGSGPVPPGSGPVPPGSGPVPPGSGPVPPGSGPVPPLPPGEGDGSNDGLSGKEVWMKECAVCHGDEGEGTARGTRLKFPVRGFATFITRNGREGHPAYAIPMPAYSRDIISNQQMSEMWDYLHSFPQPFTGKDVYQIYCANCHGEDGRGGMSGEPVLGELDEIEEYVREGEGGRMYWSRTKYMPAWSPWEISNRQIDLMINYLAGLGGGYPSHNDHDDDDDDDDDEDEDDDDDHRRNEPTRLPPGLFNDWDEDYRKRFKVRYKKPLPFYNP